MLKQNVTRTHWLHLALSTLIILFSLGINNVWADYSPGSGYTLVTNISSLSTGDYVVLFSIQNGEGVTGWNNTKDATVSSTAANWKEYYVTKSASDFTLKDEAANKFIASPGGNEFKYGTTGGACTVESDGLLTCNDRNLKKNGSNYRFYTATYTNMFYVYKKSASCSNKVALTKGAETNGSFFLTYFFLASAAFVSRLLVVCESCRGHLGIGCYHATPYIYYVYIP